MIIWEYLRWAWKYKIPHLLVACVGIWIVVIVITFAMGTALAAFARGFFWLFQLG